MTDGIRESRAREGFVLPLTLVFMLVSTLVIAAVMGYIADSARYTRAAVARDRCRLAAQSAIEQAKIEIQEGFDRYVSDNVSSIQVAPSKTRTYDWFDNVSADHLSVGRPSPITLFGGRAMPIAVNGCRVWVGIGDKVEHEQEATEAIVPIVATAEYRVSDGAVVSSTICEWMVFAVEQSPVFDNAYFVNNYGWMSGNFTINGDFRANGNVSLKNGAVVNGFVYAARNSEIGAAGTVTISSSSIYNQSKYRQTAGSRARYDIGNLDENGSYDPAKVTGTITAAVYDSDGKLIGGSMTEEGEAIVSQTQTIAGETSTVDMTPMPFVSELDSYIEYARNFEKINDDGEVIKTQGKLTYPSVTYTDGTGASHKSQGGTVLAYNPPTSAGPSGDVTMADAGSLLLVGTRDNPITIDGPVVVAGDVIIKGYVKGRGTIYAGRNVHIIGDIKYVDAPAWTHTKTGAAAEQEQAENETRDMLGLVAKGNVVVGDATSSSVAANVNSGSYIAYSCDDSDSQIGYPSTAYSTTKTTSSRYGTTTTTSKTFSGDYTATEQINSLSSTLASTAPGGYDSSSGKFGKVRTKTETYTVTETYQRWVSTGWGRGYYQTVTGPVTKERKVLETSYDRHYYETICDNAIISSLRSTVTQVDAVMYNNHGVFGSLGANFQINGALVCRDEGLTANGGCFNWDMRLRRKKKSKVVSAMGLPKGPGEPYTCRWMELPHLANPVYRRAKGLTK